MLINFLLGFSGGIIRGLTGFVKHQFSYKNVKFDLLYFLALSLICGVIGGVVSLLFQVKGVIFPFVIGYAGGDFLENIYKIITNRLKNEGRK